MRSESTAEARAPNAPVTRREALGLTGTAVAGLGLLGIALSSETARADTHVTIADHAVTLASDEAITTLTVRGRVEASYEAGGHTADTAGLNVWISSPDLAVGGFTEGAQFDYEDVDPDSGAFEEDVELTFDVPSAALDPDPGETVSVEITLHVLFQVDDEDGFITEERAEDGATLTVEREADEGDSDDGDDDDDEEDVGGSGPASAAVTGSFSMEAGTDGS